MRSILGVKCSRKALRVDGNQELLASKLAEKSAKKSLRKYAKVHPSPLPLNSPEFLKTSSQIHDQPQNQLIPERITGDCSPKSRSVRVVVTKKQLKQMLNNSEALKSMGVSIQFADRLREEGGRSPRWMPSLATIAE